MKSRDRRCADKIVSAAVADLGKRIIFRKNGKYGSSAAVLCGKCGIESEAGLFNRISQIFKEIFCLS